jgi:hypothetical protein
MDNMLLVSGKTLAAALAITLATGHATALPDQPGQELWRFLCTPSGFYAMHVSPDGSYKPKVNLTHTKPFELSVYKTGDDVRSACGRMGLTTSTYFVRVRGNDRISAFGADANFCGQMVAVFWNPDRTSLSITQLPTLGNNGLSFQIERANVDRQFVFGGLGLLTDRGAAQVNAGLQTGTNHPNRLSPMAATFMWFGTCKMVVGQ